MNFTSHLHLGARGKDKQDDSRRHLERHEPNNHRSLSKGTRAKTTSTSSEKNRFKIKKILGQGTFGIVYLAITEQTKQQVAVKKVLQQPKYKNRQLQIVSSLKHPNIVVNKSYFFSKEGEETFLFLVMEYVPETLHRVRTFYAKNKAKIPSLLVKLYAFQMLRAIAYLSDLNICHRDLKPSNLLIDTRTHLLKICDFGCAKRLVPGEESLSYVCSRFYRPPELVFGCTSYGCEVDVWSVGCIIGQMLLGFPLFYAQTSLDHMIQIVKVLGTPSQSDIQALNPNINMEINLPKLKPKRWAKVFGAEADPGCVDLVSKLLVYDPSRRLKAFEAMSHGYFKDLFRGDIKLNGKALPIADFTQQELSKHSQQIKLILKK